MQNYEHYKKISNENLQVHLNKAKRLKKNVASQS